MRTVRVIPCLDVEGGRVVKGVRFEGLRDAGDPAELARRYDEEGADEVVFLDITASSEERPTMVDVVARSAEQVFIPLTVGGGVRTVPDAMRLLRAGADKVAVNTAAVERAELVGELASELGTQCVVVAIDARARPERPGRPAGKAATRSSPTAGGGPTGLDVLEWAAVARHRAQGRSCSPRWTATGPGSATTSTSPGPSRRGSRYPSSRPEASGRSTTWWRAPCEGVPTRCSPPRSSIWESTPSRRPRPTSRRQGLPSGQRAG